MIMNLHYEDSIMFPVKEIRGLCNCVKTGDREGAREWATHTDHWNALVALSHHSQPTIKGWNCRHCTFSNGETQRECSMCGLPNEAVN